MSSDEGGRLGVFFFSTISTEMRKMPAVCPGTEERGV